MSSKQKRKLSVKMYQKRLSTPYYLFMLSIGFFIVMIILSLTSKDGIITVFDLKSDILDLKNRIYSIEASNVNLKKEAYLLKIGDKRTIEKIARNKLGMAKEGEIVIEIID